MSHKIYYRCDNLKCDATTNMMRCSRCKVAYYCSQHCQRVHYPAHKQDCDLWASKPDVDLANDLAKRLCSPDPQYRHHALSIGLKYGADRQRCLILLEVSSTIRAKMLLDEHAEWTPDNISYSIQPYGTEPNAVLWEDDLDLVEDILNSYDYKIYALIILVLRIDSHYVRNIPVMINWE